LTKNTPYKQSTWIAKDLVSAAAAHAKEALAVFWIVLVAADTLQPAASTSANIPQNVGWQFMGHMVRTTFVLLPVMAVSALGLWEILSKMGSAGTQTRRWLGQGPDLRVARLVSLTPG
jgi:uncharacterized membrane protein